jgi:cytochrome d ubiquinol oxidase subunit I
VQHVPAYSHSDRWVGASGAWGGAGEIAAELGWIVAEYGRQPWAIDGVLPTFLAVSSVSTAQVLFTLTGFVLFYSSLLVVDIVLMLRYIRMGPVGALGLPEAAIRSAALPAE